MRVVDNDNWLMFLGTAGARMVMYRQLRSSGGMVLSLGGRLAIIDPGPGTLVRFREVTPALDADRIDAVILSHRHIDHSTDTNVMIECMTAGGTRRRGAVFAPADCIENPEPIVFSYLHRVVQQVVILEEFSDYEYGPFRFCTAGYHDHPVQTLGLSFAAPLGRISFVFDTRMMADLVDWYRDSELLVINVVRQGSADASRALHLTMDDAASLIADIRPDKVILSHFGMSVLRNDPKVTATRISEQTGVSVIAAHDGLIVPLT